MIKVKDGYAKLIGTTYQGSATQVLLSNGGDLEYSASSKASTLVQRNASQHIYATYFNSAISDEALTDIGSVYVRNTSDTFIRRVSKTQFYSILDDKFVTLDTTQSITGAKTFSTSVRFANNASIIQNQNDTSNYTTILKWYKNGASRNTYDPSIGQHNTGGDGNGSICILPYPTETSPWGGMVGLFISKGVLKLDGKSVALAENYYTKTESDERYVNVTGDTMTGPLIVKAAITGTQLISTIATGTSPLKVTSTTVVTNLNSDLLDGLHETSFFRARGDQSIASSVPTTTELATSNNLCGSWNVKYTGASGHLVQFNAGSGSTRYMQFYSMYSGSLYWRNSTDSTLNTKSWKTIVDSANYTGIVLKIGTATKGSATLPIYLNAGTPTACSTTLGVSITGNAATATKLQTARTINGTSFDGTTNIVTAYWGTARTISLSGAVTGSASVNGSQNVTITTTYQFGSIDGRYVGGNKTANHGSSGTAYTADTYSSTFVNKAFVAFAERGSWAYANNGYVSTDTGVNIPLAGTAIFQWGASDTNKTQLYITPHNNSGVSNPAANEMLFYTSNGSGYTSAWTRVLTHRNYTAYTVTKTGGGASGTWGISITGSAPWANITGKPTLLTLAGITSLTNKDLNYARYNFGTTNKGDDSTQLNVPANYGLYLSLAYSDKNQGGQIFFNTVPGTTGTLYFRTRNAGDGNTVNTWKSWKTVLDSTNYTAYFNPANYVTALGTSGNYVTWTKNGATNNLTVPYATKANRLTLVSCYNGTTNNDLWSTIKTANSTYIGTATIYEVYNDGGPTTYGEVLDIVSMHSNHWQPQLWFDSGRTGSIRHRNKDYNNTTWGSWYTLLDTNNYPGLLDGRYVTLTTAQTISGIKTFSTQQKFTVATGTSPFTVSSTTVVSNLNADLLDGFHANTSQNPFGKIPTIGSDGVMEVGRYLDFHYNSSDTSDYRTRLQINHSSGSHTAILPAKSGTLAMTSDIPTVTNYYWANVKVSSSSSTSTSPTFSTAYTSNWFRSTGDTGWYSQTYGGGWNMTDTTYIRAYGSKRVYTANTEQYAFYTAGGMTAVKGFWHSAVNSNSYVLLAGGSYKNLSDFAKGNAGSATKGVYVTSGTVTAMTYSLYANVNSGTAGKLAYYSGSNALSSYTSTIGSATTPIYLSGGVPTACNGVAVKQYVNYDIICGESSASFIKNAGNFSPISRVSKVATGEVLIYIDPVYNWVTWFLLAIGGDYTTSVSSIGNASGLSVQLIYTSAPTVSRPYIHACISREKGDKTNGRFHFYILVF